jgi:hypothetical protein
VFPKDSRRRRLLTRHLEAYGEEVRVEVLRILRSKHALIDAGLPDDDDD